ncbi:MAG: hypothetical protein Q8O87_00445 [bacterium]|nr:hypothetical protein [bacterium]
MEQKLVIFATREKEAGIDLIKSAGFELVEGDPNIVMTYGGDGTLMRAEHKFPDVPKLVLRASLICKKCSPYSNEEVLKLFKDGKYVVEELQKLEAHVNNKAIIGLNDINIHNADPRHAVRYRYAINGVEQAQDVIGDGAVFATPFGSSGYYRSITKSTFERGIGMAFNNSTEPFDHMALGEEALIKITITRGPAIVFADNQSDHILLKDGDVVQIKKSSSVAKILKF